MLLELLYAVAKPRNYKTKKIRVGKIEIKAYIADTFFKTMFGLMFWRTLPKNAGMLLIFWTESRLGTAITMQKMRFPIDVIWIDSKGKVVSLFESAMPCKSFWTCKTYGPEEKAKYVLEVATGTIKRAGIKLGDKVRLNA